MPGGSERANMSNAFIPTIEDGMGDSLYNLPGSSKSSESTWDSAIKGINRSRISTEQLQRKKPASSRSSNAAKKWGNFASNLSERYVGSNSQSVSMQDEPASSIDTFDGDHTPANGNTANFSCFMQEPLVLNFSLKVNEEEDPGEYYDSWDRTDLENDFIAFAFAKGIPLDSVNDYEFEEFLIRVYQQLYPNSKAIAFWEEDTFETVEKRVLKEYLLLRYKIVAEDVVYEKMLDLSMSEIKLCVLDKRAVTLEDVDFFLSHYQSSGFEQQHYFKYSLSPSYNNLIFSLESNNCFDVVQVLNYYRNFETFQSYVNRKLNGESFEQDVCVYPELMQKLLENDYAFGDVTQGMLSEHSKSIDLLSRIVLAEDFDFEFLNRHSYKVTTINALVQHENLILDIDDLHTNLVESVYDSYMAGRISYQDIFMYLQIDLATTKKKNLQIIMFVGSYETLPPVKQLVHDYLIYLANNTGFTVRSSQNYEMELISIVVNEKPFLTLHYLEFIMAVDDYSEKFVKGCLASGKELFVEPLDSANGYSIACNAGNCVKSIQQNDKLLCSLQAWCKDLGQHKFSIELSHLDSYNLYYLLDSTSPVKGNDPDLIEDKEGSGINKNGELGRMLRERLKQFVKSEELSSKLDSVFYYFRDSNQEIIAKASFFQVASVLLGFKFMPNNKQMYARFFIMVCKQFLQHLGIETPKLKLYNEASSTTIIVHQAGSVIFNGSFSQFLRTFEALYRRLDAYKNQPQKHFVLLCEESADDLIIEIR